MTDNKVEESVYGRGRGWNIVAYIVLSLASAIAIFPLIWLGMTAFKDRITAFALPPVWIFTPTFESFKVLIGFRHMEQFMLNSAIVALGSTGFSIGVGVFCAYALARFRFRGGESIAFWILTNRMIPPLALALPLFILFQKLHWLDTRRGLIFLYTAMQLPFVVWILRGYFEDIPYELEEAAMVDGDSWFSAFRKVTLPLAGPAIAATAIFVLILSWNEFPFALILTGATSRTMPPAAVTFMVESNIHWNEIGAACLFIALPMVVFVMIVQKQFVRGLTMGMVRE